MKNTETTNEITLAERIKESAEHLTELEAEQLNLPLKLEAASIEADAQAIVELRRRYEDLPTYIKAEELKIARLRLRADEIKLSEIEDEPQKLTPPVVEAERALKEAKAAFNLALGRQSNARSDVRDLQMRIAETKRYIGRIQSEITPREAKAGRIWG